MGMWDWTKALDITNPSADIFRLSPLLDMADIAGYNKRRDAHEADFKARHDSEELKRRSDKWQGEYDDWRAAWTGLNGVKGGAVGTDGSATSSGTADPALEKAARARTASKTSALMAEGEAPDSPRGGPDSPPIAPPAPPAPGQPTAATNQHVQDRYDALSKLYVGDVDKASYDSGGRSANLYARRGMSNSGYANGAQDDLMLKAADARNKAREAARAGAMGEGMDLLRGELESAIKPQSAMELGIWQNQVSSARSDAANARAAEEANRQAVLKIIASMYAGSISPGSLEAVGGGNSMLAEDWAGNGSWQPIG